MIFDLDGTLVDSFTTVVAIHINECVRYHGDFRTDFETAQLLNIEYVQITSV